MTTKRESKRDEKERKQKKKVSTQPRSSTRERENKKEIFILNLFMGVVENIYLLMLLRIRDLTSQIYICFHILLPPSISLYLNECNDKHFSAVALSDKYIRTCVKH